MFNSEGQGQNAVAVTLKLTSGETEKGRLHAGITGKLSDAINKPTPFVELIGSDGTVTFIAKSNIARIDPLDVPRVDQLSKRLAEDGIPDPHSVLGIKKSAGEKDIQSAYHALAKRYHPDNFSGQELPTEVLHYVAAMFKRITTAYNELKESLDTSEAA